ncbi:hypothetical protein JRQ81_012990 [Phrynocephalus forsythii]|uniref:Uncharacterized protein n=1 Tax=Phrynocephalus forsythii TaxID=171643 RepID=A0A9Q0Y0X8_9SAUR|nr:hypothetical protein JRQ81_012990 [Phrynocephalus forsythii]
MVISDHPMKGKSVIKRRNSSDLWTMNQAAKTRTNESILSNLVSSRHAENDEEKSVIAQPAFVFKKEQPYKMPTEDPVCKTENDFKLRRLSCVSSSSVSIGCSRKRPRSSSFSFQLSDTQMHRGMTASPSSLFNDVAFFWFCIKVTSYQNLVWNPIHWT